MWPLYSVRHYIGAPMSPSVAPIIFNYVFPDFFSCSVRHYYWRRVHQCANSIGGLEVRLLCSVHLAYFQANRLLIELYKQETEIRGRKDDGPIKNDHHGPKVYSNSTQTPDAPHFSLPTNFKYIFYI